MTQATGSRVPQVGEPAPDFTLPYAPRETVTLSQYRGQKHVVLAFYVMDFTGGWENEITSLQAALPRFEERNAQVLSVSCDSIFSHKGWADHLGGISFPMLSDFHPKGKVCDLYGVYNHERGVPRRSTFIIDKEGVVRVAEVYERGLPDIEKLLADLDRIEGRAVE